MLNLNRNAFITLAFAAAVTLISGCATMGSGPKTVADTIAADPQFSTLSKLVQQAGLTDTLKSAGPFTVFAPNDAAFKTVPAKTLDELGKDPAKLRNVLTFHVLPAKVTAAEVKQGSAKTVQGANLAIAKAGSFVTVEDATVVKADIMATNGVIHAVDRVMLPPAPAR
jgi:uncharacterized surface protein with fasciclin (FAS1) repeats